MHLAKVRLREDAPLSPAFWTLFSDLQAVHKLAWDFFGDSPDRRRDFLFRLDVAAARPTFYTVSERPPQADPRLWDVWSAPYDLQAQAGDRFSFALRANPTKRAPAAPGEERPTRGGGRHDVVMDAKRKLAQEGVSPAMAELVQESGTSWLRRQGQAHGFELVATRADGYRQHRFEGGERGRGISLTSIDYEGILQVQDPDLFGEALRTGIGPAKAFGFGLLLVRRA